jgi:short-subunit dehydrogenase
MDDQMAMPPETPLEPYPRAVVIGASSGIGAAVAHRLAKEGYILALLARREGALNQVCEQINGQAGKTLAHPYVHDVTRLEDISQLFQTILRDLKRIDLMVYAAGVMPPVGGSEFNIEKDRAMIEVNLMGAIAWLGQAATLFDRMGAGHLVAISSVAGDRGRVLNPGYNASKAGLDTYLEALRNRLSKKGVKVTTIKPGQVDTAMLEGVERTFWVITPDEVAEDIWGAIRSGKQTIYTPPRWRWMMLIIRHIPSVIFRRLSF